MDALLEFAHTVVNLDAMLIAVVFVAGVVIAPVVILIRGACWWKQRLKWAAVAFLTSWLGLWLFWRKQAPAAHESPNRSVVRPS